MKPELQIVRAHQATLDDAIREVNICWGKSADADNKAHTLRVDAGQKLLALRKRVEAGEAGEEFQNNWWGWYRGRFVRSRRDAEKVMALASNPDPEAAHEAEKAKKRKTQPTVTAPGRNESTADEESDAVEEVMALIDALTDDQRSLLFARLEDSYQWQR